METIKLNVNNFWFKYWEFVNFHPNYRERPADTCALRGNLIWSTFAMLITLPTFIVFKIIGLIAIGFEQSLSENASKGILIACQMVSFITIEALVNPAPFVGFLFGPLFVMALSAIAAIFLFLLYIIGLTIYTCFVKIFPKKEKVEKTSSIIKTLYTSWKDKLCSKIEYTDNLVPDKKEPDDWYL